MRRRTRSTPGGDLPTTLRHLVRAAETECPEGHAEALTELTKLALKKVPSRGLFDPAVRGEPDLFAAIDGIAMRHLSLADARQAWRGALNASELPFSRRDELERAAHQVQDVSDTAYFYAGLAFGLAFVCAYRTG